MAGLIPNLPNFGLFLPWFMFDLQNFQLITSVLPPGDIQDRKPIILTETPVPGLNYQPVQPSSNGNRKISFMLPLIRRNNSVGNILLLKQFDRLRNQASGFLNATAQQFTPNPKVLYNWGTGSVPLEWYVTRCDATHKQGWINPFGNPMYSELDIELTLDEESPLYKAEEMYRLVASIAGDLGGVADSVLGQVNVRPF